MVLSFHKIVQLHLLELYRADGAKAEVSFFSSKRRADVYVPGKGIVFEIQVSKISVEEVRGRITDYESLGIDIVWILDMNTFDPENPTAVEKYLQKRNRYYCSLFENSVHFFDITPYETSKSLLCTPFEVEIDTLTPLIHTKLTSIYKPFATLYCKDDWLFEVHFNENVQAFVKWDYAPKRAPLAFWRVAINRLKGMIDDAFRELYTGVTEEEEWRVALEDELRAIENREVPRAQVPSETIL